jgi:hypothetical protein
MKFFANQKQDEAGKVGISLQKLLIFFMVLDGTIFVLGANFGTFMSFLYHAIVLMGVYRRRTCVLLIYTVLNVIMFVLTGFVLLLVIVALSITSTEIDTSSGQYTSSGDVHSSYNSFQFHRTVSSFVRSSWTNSTSSFSSSDSGDITPPNANASSYDDQTIFIAALLALVFSMVLLYCKVLSTILAHRMRKILLAGNQLPVYTPVPTEETPREAPVYQPEAAAYDPTNPMFQGFAPFPMQPGFYPNFQGAPQGMMPPPFMYGPQPVFYTFAPPAQPANNVNDKL